LKNRLIIDSYPSISGRYKIKSIQPFSSTVMLNLFISIHAVAALVATLRQNNHALNALGSCSINAFHPLLPNHRFLLPSTKFIQKFPYSPLSNFIRKNYNRLQCIV